MAGRHIIIGDVHGMSEALRLLIDRLCPQAGDCVIFVGDILDKGPDPVGVVRMVRDVAENARFEVILVEGNHEELHRRYRRNLTERPTIAKEQAVRVPELATTTARLARDDIAYLDAAVPFHRIAEHDLLVVHGGIPGDMDSFPDTVEEARALTGKARRKFDKVLRTRFVEAKTGRFLMKDHETEADPFWADIYDGRFGHVVFGHVPFMDGPRHFPFATAIDTGAVHGGALTALTIGPDGGRTFVSVP
ncbi:MAG: serine/threonine protein phosphatase [Hyphomicrobiales bacterium]|nr:serine/threonine protein phosphatase [Hyphomicrobiales bacterium]